METKPPPFSKGQWLIKKNLDFFKVKSPEAKYLPAIQVISINKKTFHKKHEEKVRWLINGKFDVFEDTDNLEIVTEAEGRRLNDLYLSLTESEPEKKSVEETCFSTYTGVRTEKVKFEKFDYLRKALFQFMVKRPDEHFTGYKCPNCGFYHIGKQEN